VLQADGPVRRLRLTTRASELVVVTDNMVIGQFNVEHDGGVKETSRLTHSLDNCVHMFMRMPFSSFTQSQTEHENQGEPHCLAGRAPFGRQRRRPDRARVEPQDRPELCVERFGSHRRRRWRRRRPAVHHLPSVLGRQESGGGRHQLRYGGHVALLGRRQLLRGNSLAPPTLHSHRIGGQERDLGRGRERLFPQHHEVTLSCSSHEYV
jgi:hypothetical protein